VAFAADVLHHCPDPRAALADMARCTGRWLLLKDHTYSGPAGYATLCFLDEIGNRRFHIPSLYKYQKHWTWSAWLEELGFRLVRRTYPARVHVGLMGRLTNHLQYVDLWEREGEREGERERET